MPVDGVPAPETAAPAAPAAPAAVSSPAAAAPTPAAPAPKTDAPAAGDSAAKPAESLVSAAKPADAPAAEKPPEATPAPEPIDLGSLKLPEGFTLHEKGKEQLGELLKANPTVSKEFVENLLGHHAAEMKALSDRQVESWNTLRTTWVNEIKADAEIGGRNLEPALQSIGKMISHFGGDQADSVREAFNLTGSGDNPAIVRFLHRVSKALNEGGYVSGDTARAGRRSAAETLWPPDESGQVRSAVRNNR